MIQAVRLNQLKPSIDVNPEATIDVNPESAESVEEVHNIIQDSEKVTGNYSLFTLG